MTKAAVVFTLLTASASTRSANAGQAEAVSPVTVSGSGFTVGELRTGATAFNNRAYTWLTVPDALAGWKFTRLSGGGPAASLSVRADRDGDLYIAATRPPPAGDWQPVPGLALTYSDKGRTTLPLFRIRLRAGVTLPVPQSGWAGTLVLAPGLTGTAETPTPPPVTTVGPPPGTVISFSPPATGIYIGSPALAVLPDGTYIAAHDFFGRGGGGDRMRVFRSSDRGRTWAALADIKGQYWSSLFVHDGALYLLGTSRGSGSIVIRRSLDGGRTWTEPRDAASGLLVTGGGYHCAPTPVLVHNGRLWRAFEVQPPGFKTRRFGALLLSAPVSGANLLRADSWTRTAPLAYDPAVTGGNWLEGNAVAAPDGSVVNILRVDARGPERAALLTLSSDGRTLGWTPPRDRVAFPGSKVKFTIRWDPVTRRYWSIVNKKSNPAANRNLLALTSSPDLRNWRVEATLLFHPDQARVAFQYVDWLFEGDDLITVSRTAWGGAHNFHDADYLTFHRIRRFRDASARMVE
jgi:hypothetical protein